VDQRYVAQQHLSSSQANVSPAIGIFQTVYETTILKEYSPSTVAWIVSLETFFMFLGGPVMGLLFDNYGPRWLLLVGTFLHVFGLMMASISTQYWHFILAQGICSPLGASAVFYAAMSSVVTWFHRRRGLALGVTASGSSLGGVIFPIMVQKLIPKVGFPWAMRIAAFTILALLAIANLTVRSRLTPTPRRFSPMAFVRPLGEPTFLILALAAFLVFFGLFIPFTFLPLEGLTVGIDPTLDLYIIPILNAVSIFGRITPGYLSDKVGRFNTTIAMCGLCGVLILALWLPATAPAPVIVFAALYGFGSGAFVSLVPALVATICSDMRQIGTRNGTVFAAVSIGALCGNPIAGALVGQQGGAYFNLKVFAGAFVCAGTLLLVVVRVILNRRVWAKI
jgi:MFS family permease